MANSLEQVLNRVKQILSPVASNAMTAARRTYNQLPETLEPLRKSYNTVTQGLKEASAYRQTVPLQQRVGSALQNAKSDPIKYSLYGQMAQSKIKPIRYGGKAIEGTLEGLTANLLDIPAPVSQNNADRLAYVGGNVLGMVSPVSALNLAGKVVSKAPMISQLQKPLGSVAGKLISKGGASKLAGKAVANLSQGAPYTLGYMGLKQAVSPITGQGYTGGDLAGDVGVDLTVGALGAFPIFAGLSKMSKDKRIREVLKNEFDIKDIIYSVDNYDKLQPNIQIRAWEKIDNIARKVIPEVVGSKELKKLKTTDPSRWLELTSRYLDDALVQAKNPSMDIGLSTRALGGQKPPTNKIPVKRDLTQQVAESVTGKKMKVKPSVQTVETPPVAPMVEPEVVKSNNRAIKAGVPSRETVKASLPQRLDNFIQETLDYTTQAPTGGTREAGAYTKLLRSGQEKVTSAVERGLGSENPLIRNAASTMQGFFRGLGMSPERAIQSAETRGGLSNSIERSFNVMNKLYETLGKNKESLTRINAVLDPDISKTKVKLSDLTPDEKATYNLIRKGFDYIHDTNYANGFVTEKVYKSNLGKYTPRRYTIFETPAEINPFTKQTKKIDINSYKKRKELDAWKVENSLNDPVYALGRALAQTESNVVIKKYTDYLATQPNLITDVPRPGFTKLSDSSAYGALSGKYVLNSAAEDLKGFFFANESLQKVYDVFRAYDRLPIRQLQKKLMTVFNPTTNVGNIVSDQVFGWGAGVDPLTLNKNLYQVKKKPELYKQLSDYLMSKGIVGTDITRTDFVDKLSSIDDLATQVSKPQSKIKTISNKVQSFYGGTDDAYKVAAFKSLLDKGFTLEEATRKVADGFQNYANVGKFYDTWAKTPLVGSPFIKFQGDLMRIVKNAAVNNPLGLISFLGTLQAVAYLSSKASGETPEDYKTRTERFAAPMIPGLNIPLTWQTPIGELNVARYISPFYANNDVTSVSKMIPFVPNIDTKKDAATNIALNSNDPLLAPIAQTLVNRDFRGKPISDPDEKKWSPSTTTPSEQNMNKVKFLGRAYAPPPVNSVLDVGSALQGKPNMYGSNQTPGQALARLGGVKISQFGPEQAQAQRVNDAYYDQKQLESNMDLEKAITKDLLSGKIDQKTADARIANVYKDSGSATKVLGEGITQLQNGSYATLIDGKLKEFDTPEEAQKAVTKYEFKQSGKNIDIIGDTVWRRSKDGDATSEPKIDYDTKMTTQKMENAKLSDDYKTWQDLAFTQLQNYQTQMQDPTLDELEKGDLQQKIDKLIRDALKYQGQGGLKKGKKPKAPPKMQVAKFGKTSFKMKRDSSAKSKKIKVVASKKIAPPKVAVSRFKVKKA